jgi:hypothetical protein
VKLAAEQVRAVLYAVRVDAHEVHTRRRAAADDGHARKDTPHVLFLQQQICKLTGRTKRGPIGGSMRCNGRSIRDRRSRPLRRRGSPAMLFCRWRTTTSSRPRATHNVEKKRR